MPSQPDPSPWWADALVYQIYPRSFCDTTGNGVGDLEGVRRHLDHIANLGVDAIWLSPFYPSPMKDYGYDVADYCDVDPLFGDLGVFDRLLADAHQRDLRVLIDWVPNHTSDQHPWFLDARSSRTSLRRDWYHWRDPRPDGGLPNNWVEALTMGPAWAFDDDTGQYYLHNFLPSQPDLNWSNPAVVDAMFDTLRFWLDRGVDGFRMDVINLIGKDPELPDDPADLVGLPHLVLNDRPETHALLRQIRALLDSYPGDRMAVGEVVLLTIEGILGHLGTHETPELHLAFNFPPMHHGWDAAAWRTSIRTTVDAYAAVGATPTWVLSNHDVARHRTRYGGSEAVARAAAVLLMTLPGTAFLYAGEELGLEDAVVPPERMLDPGGRDGCRAPIPWDDSASHGWASSDPWLPWPPEATTRNVAAQTADAGSILHLYRRLVGLRHKLSGSLRLLDGPEEVVIFERDDHTVAVNFANHPVPADLDGTLLLSSVKERQDPGGRLEPHEAVILQR